MPPASPSTARALNDRLALRLLQERGPLSASELKTLTGLARPTVADLVQRLQDTGLIRLVGESATKRRGPNARLYGIAADRAHLAALDMRTDGVRVLVTDLLGTTLAESALPVSPDTPSEAAARGSADLLEQTAKQAGAEPLHTVAVGAPGLIDPATGALRETSGRAWHHQLIALLQQRLPATVRLENETNLAAMAEQRQGAARDRESFVLLWLGDGVGAAVVLDGRLRRGTSGGAGEIGFLPVPGTVGLPSAVSCEGGLHSLLSATAVCALAVEHGFAATAGTGDTPAAQETVRAAVAAGAGGEPFLTALASRVSLGAAAVTAILDPGCVVLGGELGQAGGTVFATLVQEQLAALSPLRTEVRPGELGGAGVLRGALLAAQDAAQQVLFPPVA
ncbi:ROK family transcriptional regulator [Streptomyces sp. N2-109]|uniref:ROK family transcriptional regulator n=1 Tax=Streptomyces gossypii TaxID=2883101 RepID=A0ABT2JPT8_9ACTN|nr:ROK family transcriptional regulator [Streptomyces gossypii]MCT2589880.1 ROK family transcriptional regulator [Streptomyces gossypii]